MKRNFFWAAFLSLSLVVACRLDAQLLPTSPPVEKARPRPAWQNQWDKLVVDAKAEGKVVIYTVAPAEVRKSLPDVFKRKFGVDLEFLAGIGAEMVPKMDRERRAGLYLVDVTMLGWGSYVNMIKPLNITVPIEPLLVLPEIRDTTRWLRGRLPVMDKDGHAYALNMSAPSHHILNTDLVKPGEISSVRDFLNPKWKGKLGLFDLGIPGPGISWYRLVLKDILGQEQGRAYMRELSQSIAAITRDYRALPEWVARGKYPIAISARSDEIMAFQRDGAPIEFIDTNEPRIVNPTWGVFQVIRDRPHPNATQLFINWILTQEGLSELVRSSQTPTTRLDVSTAGIKPNLVSRPNDIVVTEDSEAEIPELVRMAREDFAVLYK